MYDVLYLAQRKYPGLKADFIRVPYAVEQLIGKDASTPRMSLNNITKSLKYALKEITKGRKDRAVIFGKIH